MNIQDMQMTAVFMIFLVISIPLCASNVVAVDVSGTVKTYAKNSDGVLNYRAENDQTTIYAEIAKSGVSASSVNLVGVKNVPFTSCTSDAEKSICTYQFAAGPWRLVNSNGIFSYGVDYQGNRDTGEVVVDNLAPNVTINSITQGGNLFVSYTIDERAFSAGDSSRCSGVKTVEFYLGAEKLMTLGLNKTPGQECTFSQLTNMSAPSTNNVEKNFCLKVYDNVGNKGEACQLIVVDKEPAQASNPAVVGLNGNQIRFVSAKTGPISAKVKFNLIERNVSRISADASDFSVYDLQKQQMKQVSVYCEPETCGGVCICETNTITLNLPQGGTPNLKLNVLDKAGNEANLSVPVFIDSDNAAPVLKSLTAKQCGNKNAIGKTSNSVTAEIQESGSGFVARKMYLDLSRVNSKYPSVYPNQCSALGNIWLCNWGVFDVNTGIVHGASVPIKLIFPSQDDAGNYIESNQTQLFYDAQSPVYSNHQITAHSASALGEDIMAYPTTGGTIQLTVNAVDDTPVTATADFSAVAHTAKQTVECSGTENQSCVFDEVGPLIAGPIFNAPIKLILTDCVGNSFNKTIYINVSVIEQTLGDYWIYSLGDAMPKQVDRQTLTVIPHKVYTPVYLTPLASATPISQQIIKCEGKTDAGASVTDYLAQSLITNQRIPDLIGAPSTSPYAKINLAVNKDPPDTLNILCTFKTISRTSDGRITQPEYDNVTFVVGFYNSRVGTIDKALQDKVDKVKNSGLVQLNSVIKTMIDVLAIADGVCAVWNILLDVGRLFALIDIILGPLQYTPFTAVSAAADRVHVLNVVGLGAVAPIMTTICNIISCNILPLEDITKVIKNALEIWQGKALGKAFGFEANTEITPRDSLIVSVATLCLPGIIYNLQKARAIECSYIYCINTRVPYGEPPYFCEAERASQWCKYVWGEIFQLLPFAQFIDEMLDAIKDLIGSPVGIASAALLLCIKIPDNTAKGICSEILIWMEIASTVAKLTSANTWNQLSFKPSGGDICAAVLEEKQE